jgi:sugar phosphate isomerase/epimerase
MKVSVGINNCYACKRWPEPDVWGAHVRDRWKLRHVQFSFDLLDPRCSESARDSMCGAVRNASEKYGFTIHSAFTGVAAYTYNLLSHPFPEFRADALKWCEQACVVAEKIGAGGVGGSVAAASVSSLADGETWEYLTRALVESMRYFARYAAAHGRSFVLWEPTPVRREFTQSIDEARRLYERFNTDVPIPVYFCIDVGHQCASGLKGQDRDPYAWLEKLGRYSPVVHVQQTDGMSDHHWPFTKEYNRQGIIKIDRVLESLDKSGLKEVVLILEAIHAFECEEHKVLEDLDESFEYLKRFES